MVKFIVIKSPDEWATTKQACRDELVVYLFFFSHIYLALPLFIEHCFYEHKLHRGFCRAKHVQVIGTFVIQ